MNLIFIYGPPATGKLTVAKELVKLTRYKLFHNHLTNDLVESIFKFGTKEFFRFTGKFKLELFEATAKHKVNGLIFTFCYAHPHDNKFVEEIIDKIKKHKGKVKFVQLTCSNAALFKRVKGASRENFGKLKDIRNLKKCLNEWNLITPIPFVKTLKIENTKLSPKKAASKIKEHYKL